MKGKRKCDFLRLIREEMAEKNGISYEPRKCDYQGDCPGTCPLCEQEAAELLDALKEKEAHGEEIKTVDEQTVNLACAFIRTDDAQNDADTEKGEDVTMGEIAYEDEKIRQRKIMELLLNTKETQGVVREEPYNTPMDKELKEAHDLLEEAIKKK